MTSQSPLVPPFQSALRWESAADGSFKARTTMSIDRRCPRCVSAAASASASASTYGNADCTVFAKPVELTKDGDGEGDREWITRSCLTCMKRHRPCPFSGVTVKSLDDFERTGDKDLLVKVMSGKIPPQHPNNYQHDHDHEYEYEYEYEHERINEGDDRRMKIRIPRLPPRSAGYDTQQTTQDTRNPRTSQMTGSDVNATPRINQNTLNLSDSDAPLSMIEPGPSTPSISDNEVQSDLFEFIDFGEQADDEHNHSIIIAPDTETQGEMELWHGISEALYAPSGYGSRLSDLL